jgi:hypothetical protein
VDNYEWGPGEAAEIDLRIYLANCNGPQSHQEIGPNRELPHGRLREIFRARVEIMEAAGRARKIAQNIEQKRESGGGGGS